MEEYPYLGTSIYLLLKSKMTVNETFVSSHFFDVDMLI
ncbi:hypothetical protein LOT_2264 [Lentilactobacillus otakiensis DSM 19908 = JCM 15040]|uniref:Uncharacterized protein n=1 Tax=Lentilactobacillus otakiensis DSM 19908 = JCM 15040 TaxID=1423780 RepID=S4NPK3_9LACO|nr:hypothetical protein LOT_2264 [Lentilactobacillus otakiensis DSM 19908 = JCM 15040]